MVALKSLLVLLALGTETFAAAVNPSVACLTDLGTKTVKNVPTSTSTTIKKVTIVKKIIKKVNVFVIPVAKTTTIRTTSSVISTVTAVQNTNKATSIITCNTRTATTSTTSTSFTTTTRLITSTVARNPGFTAILNDPLYEAKKRDVKRAAKLQMLTATKSSPLYPQRVRCGKEVPSYSTKVVTTIVNGKRVTLKAATRTKMSTITTTILTTEFPEDASTTVFETTRPVVTSFTDTTSTTTHTQTVTVESQVPQAIVYDACSSDNILLTANRGGRVVAWMDVNSESIPTIMGNNFSPAQCCNECASRPNCRISLLGRLAGFSQSTTTTCSLFLTQNADKCANFQQPTFARYVTSNFSPAEPQFIYSNGPCGQLRNGGDLQGL